MNFRRCLIHVSILIAFLVSLSPVDAKEAVKETKFQHGHRSSRIKYLSMRKQRYQNIIDTNIFQLVTLYLEDGEYSKALPVLRTAATKSPDEKSRWTALYVIGDIEWVEFSNYAKAIQAFEKVRGTLKPICDGALVDLWGQLGLKKDSRQTALAALERLELYARRDKSRYVREHALAKIAFAKVEIYKTTNEKKKAIQACRSLLTEVKYPEIIKRAERTIQTLK